MILLKINLHFKPYIFQGWIPLWGLLKDKDNNSAY